MTRARLPSAFAIAIIAILALGPAAACSRAPAGATAPPAPRSAAVHAEPGARAADADPAPRSASDRELERYAERERETSGLERFAGGRGQETTIIIILLVAILVVILI